MKYLLIIFLFTISFFNYAYADSYICTYTFKKENLVAVYERKGSNNFLITNSYGQEFYEKILYEDEKLLVIGNNSTYTPEDIAIFGFNVTIIDKIKKIYINQAVLEPSTNYSSSKNTGNCLYKN